MIGFVAGVAEARGEDGALFTFLNAGKRSVVGLTVNCMLPI